MKFLLVIQICIDLHAMHTLFNKLYEFTIAIGFSEFLLSILR